ncbi:MAG: sulfatase-like hydrolase/transferase, partial [Caulobacterales bacterium]|nr:sulfatase-like hydrolase/transferase [Caulobacterales bacterium]
HVSATPFRLYKSFVAEGGIRTPAIVRYGNAFEQGARLDGLTSVLDIAPTLLEAAGGEASADELDGASLYGALAGGAHLDGATPRYALEAYGGRAYFEGDWKLVWLWPPEGAGDWALYNLADDPGETDDLRAAHPERAAAMIAAWEAFADANEVHRFDKDIGYGRYRDQKEPDAR